MQLSRKLQLSVDNAICTGKIDHGQRFRLLPSIDRSASRRRRFTRRATSESCGMVRKAVAWCELNNYELAEVFVDSGISGKRQDNRPELQRALDAVCVTLGSAIVVYSLSRLSRSVQDTLQIATRLEKAGADLVSLSERIDTTSAAGRMVFKMLAVLAKFEREQVSERTTMAMAHKRSRGERLGQVPYGYNVAADGITLEQNSAEQQALGLIRELKGLGMTLRAIATELNRRGVVTKSGGTTWKHTTVASILARVW